MAHDTSPAGVAPINLDPFSYFADAASKIRPLGGASDRAELSYGFHTHYVRCLPGYCTFSVEIDDLVATSGVLHLQVHMLSGAKGAHAQVATIERLELAQLASTGGGRATVRFESLRGRTYALFGRISDTTDATATALRVQLDRPGDETDDVLPDAQPTSLGQSSARASDQLTSMEPPSFATPVSQICTSAQIREPAFLRWCAALDQPAAVSIPLWENCFVLQAMHRYGLISREAEGLGLAELDGPIVPMLTARGCRLVLAEHGSADETPEEWQNRNRRVLDQHKMPANEQDRVRIVPAYLLAPHDDLGQFDFLWSSGLALGLGSMAAAYTMIFNSMARLRPGGLAVHMLRLNTSSETFSDAASISFSRSDIQRLALDMISHGHIVAQLRFDDGRGLMDPALPSDMASLGLIIRRG